MSQISHLHLIVRPDTPTGQNISFEQIVKPYLKITDFLSEILKGYDEKQKEDHFPQRSVQVCCLMVNGGIYISKWVTDGRLLRFLNISHQPCTIYPASPNISIERVLDFSRSKAFKCLHFLWCQDKTSTPTDFYLEVLHQNRSLLRDVEVLSERIQNMYNFQLLRQFDHKPIV